MIIVITCF